MRQEVVPPYAVALLLVVCLLVALSTAFFATLAPLAVFAGALVVATFLYPAYGLIALSAFFLVSASPLYQAYGIVGRSYTASDLLGVVIVVGWLRQFLLEGRAGSVAGGVRSRWQAADLAVLAVGGYFLWGIVSTLWSSASLGDTFNAIRGSAEAFIIFLLCVALLRGKREIRWAAGVYAAVGVLLAVYTIRTFAHNGGFIATPDSIYQNLSYRGAVTYNANELGIILACVPMFAYLALEGRRRIVQLLVTAGTLPVVGLAIAILASRETYIAVGIAIGAAVFLSRGFKYRIAAAVVLLVLGGGFFLALNADSLPFWVTQRFSRADVATLGSRTPFWAVGLNLFAQNPIGGLGLGGFQNIIGSFHVSYFLGVSDTHSEYILALVDTGIIGFLFLIGALASIARTVIVGSSRNVAVTINLLIPLVGMAAGSLGRSHWLWVVFGILYCYGRFQPRVEVEAPVVAAEPEEVPSTPVALLPALPRST